MPAERKTRLLEVMEVLDRQEHYPQESCRLQSLQNMVRQVAHVNVVLQIMGMISSGYDVFQIEHPPRCLSSEAHADTS